MIENREMTKRIKINVSDIDKAQDRNFVFYVYESLLNSLLNDNAAVSHIYCLKQQDKWDIEFDLLVGKKGDFTWVLMRENLACIAESEPDVKITIIDIEDSGTGVIFTMGRLML